MLTIDHLEVLFALYLLESLPKCLVSCPLPPKS